MLVTILLKTDNKVFVMVFLQMWECRSDIFQHRLCSKEGDSSGRCDPSECIGKHIKGKECTVLDSIINLICHTSKSKSKSYVQATTTLKIIKGF
jgi:hypothetical protein